MKHSMSTSSQCLSPSTLLDDPHLDHAFDAPRLLRPSSGIPSSASLRSTLRKPCVISEDLVHQTPKSLHSEYPSKCLAFEDFVSRSDLDPFAAFVTELPARLASSLLLDPDFPWGIHEEGWLYQAVPDKKTLRVMHGGKTVMIGEKSGTHQYKLQGSVVEGRQSLCVDPSFYTVCLPISDHRTLTRAAALVPHTPPYAGPPHVACAVCNLLTATTSHTTLTAPTDLHVDAPR
ncbi:hypothetical protein GUJ93_ZPchr0010g8444 [Zizania palustris]|uniref:Uncharacterized protein n=1 Tax=Zizania palustris TaxID=103762 RepID=A0A8J6BM09_ZIZPA|nr:hypothetical protein GUJ93_ZPchr0010g8444 [Zizania palustris]